MTQEKDMVTPTTQVLHEACMEGNLSEIKELLQAGADPNEFNEAGRTPLHLAIISGRPDIYTVVEALITHGANVNLASHPGEESPLHLTLKHVPAEMAELVALRLIQNGADAGHRDRSLRNSYDYALGHSYMQVVRVVEDIVPVHEAVHKLLDQRVEIDARQLILAIQQGRLDDIHKCLARGASVNYIDPNGAAAIHYLIAKSPINKPPVLLLLLDAKADVNLRTYEGDNALNLAIKSDNFRDVDERREVIEILLKTGCMVNSKDLDGKDAQALALERGYHDVMDRMDDIYPSKEIPLDVIKIDRFSFVDLGYYDYWEALRRRILQESYTDLTEFVENARIDMNAADEEGRMCLHWAVLRENTEHLHDIMPLLLEHGANIDSLSKHDGTPLHLAAETGNVLAVKTLLSLGADDLYRDEEGNTPLVKAMKNKNAEIVKVLTLHKQKRNSSVYASTQEVENDSGETVDQSDGAAEQSQNGEILQREGQTPTNNREQKKQKNKSRMCIIT